MSEPWPLYDLFLDLPHPAASPSCPPPFIVGSPSTSKDIQKELGEAASIARIARFAFPEFDDELAPPPKPPPESPGLNRFDVYSTKGFQRHTFSLQLACGQRVHGHVRRYLPTHQQAAFRYDVGRRGVRALVLLTRASAGDSCYAAILKTIQAISALQAAVPKHLEPHPKPQEHFLMMFQELFVRYCQYYAKKPDDERAPMLLTVEGIECASSKLAGIDTSRFLLPVSLLQPPNAVSSISSMTESPILPLLRCLGVPNTLRLLSALLSDRRILLVSSSPTRLTNCARSALSILAQGQLHWQHLFIPVLPPHLFQYLQAPMPYLVGMLSSNMGKLNYMQELGEMLLINLDQNALETRGIPTHLVATRIPDLCKGAEIDPNSNTYAEMSAADNLIQDLLELIKADKRNMTGGESGVQETAAQTVKAVKSAFGKIRKLGKEYIQQKSASDYDTPVTPLETPTPPANLEDDIYLEGVQNDVGEEEARIAFAMFFLCAYGDMRWYLMSGPTPQLDRNRFLQQKRAIDGEALYPLYQNMCHSQMFDQFVKERVEEISNRIPVTKDSTLFAVCSNYHRKNQIDFTVMSVRRVARQVAQANPGRLVSQANANARRLAMALTSNKTFEGNHGQAVAQLVEMAHETSSVLCEVMSVIWMRLADSRGMQWKHALYSFQILRNLLYHGPLAAISEATDGLDRIRKLKAYNDTMRGQNCQQIQMAAAEVYNLLVDLAKLFSIRRVSADRRRVMKNPPKGQLPRETRLRIGLPFRGVHAALSPSNNRRQVAPAPGHPVQQSSAPGPVKDLLGFDSPTAPAQPPQNSGVGDLLGSFDSQVSITKPAAAPYPQRGAPVHPLNPPTPVCDPFGAPSAPQAQQQRPPPPQQQQQQRPPSSPQPHMSQFAPGHPQQQQRLPPSHQPPMDPFAPVPPQQQYPQSSSQLPMDPFAPPQQQYPPPSSQPSMDPFAPPQQRPTATPNPPMSMDPFAAAPSPQQYPPQNRAGPFGGPMQQSPQGYPPLGYPGMPPGPGRPVQPNMQPPPPNMRPPGPVQPQQQFQMGNRPNGYPGQPPNMFASPPPQQQAQQPPKKNFSQFDPLSR